MRATNMKKAIVKTQVLLAAMVARGHPVHGLRVGCGSWHQGHLL